MPSAHGWGPTTTQGYATPTITVLDGTTEISPARATARFSNPPFPSINSLAVDTVMHTCLAAGWKYVGDSRAVGGIFAAFGWGSISFQRVAAIIFGVAFEYYDPWAPFFESPPTGKFMPFGPSGPSYDIFAVPTAVSGTDSANRDQLIASINSAFPGLLIATADPFSLMDIIITADAGLYGTLGNGVNIGSSPISSAYFGGILGGGGWIMESPPMVDPSGYPDPNQVPAGNEAYIRLHVYTGTPAEVAGSMSISFETPTRASPSIVYPLAKATYTMIAGTYQVIFIEESGFSSVDVYGGDSFAWICTPFTDSLGKRTVDQAAFFVTTPAFPGIPTMGQPIPDVDAQTWVNGYHANLGINQLAFGFAMLWSDSATDTQVQDVAGQQIMSPAFVMLPGGLGESRVSGLIPDGFIVSKKHNGLEQVFEPLSPLPGEFAGYFRCVAFQDAPSAAPQGAVFVATGETGSGPSQLDVNYSFIGEATVSGSTINITHVRINHNQTVPVNMADWLGHQIVLSGGAPNTIYTITAATFDGFGNPQTFTITPAAPLFLNTTVVGVLR